MDCVVADVVDASRLQAHTNIGRRGVDRDARERVFKGFARVWILAEPTREI